MNVSIYIYGCILPISCISGGLFIFVIQGQGHVPQRRACGAGVVECLGIWAFVGVLDGRYKASSTVAGVRR